MKDSPTVKLVREIGMKRLLEELIEYTDSINSRKELYLNRLSCDLDEALENYERRYDNEKNDP